MTGNTQPRQIIPLKSEWRFQLSDIPKAAYPDFSDATWQNVRIPHDWAIAGPFDRENDVQYTKIVENGETKPYAHTGRTGALPHVGIGWYRRSIHVPAEWRHKRIYVEFDGVMSRSTVYCNGVEVGGRPYGYSSFSLELTNQINFGADNLLAVRVANPAGASRWYPGAGIYRQVRLVVVEPVHVCYMGTWVTAQVTAGKATLQMQTEIANQMSTQQDVTVDTKVYSPSGACVASVESRVSVDKLVTCRQQLTIDNPELWDIERPQLYKAVSQLSVLGEVVDGYETYFGIRTVRFDANQGFFLNDRPLKLQGVCMHHDLGALGTAVNRRALRRQLEIMQEMGCNAIRTSHNPPAPELLELCDSMGFLVIDEAFDEWRIGKTPNGYHTLFDEWAEKDLRDMIRRDRNHPCVIMWSIGNEVGEQRTADGAAVGRFLTDICHDQDPTRPVTIGFSVPDHPITNGLAAVVDIPGWNYKPHLYLRYHQEHPQWLLYGSETASCVSSRGEYYFPAEQECPGKRATLHVTSYDMAAPRWASPPDYEFAAQDACPFILGEFVWTGFDYLGEPTPYEHEWPSRSSYFGIVDLCGFPKDRYYLYRSRWSKRPTLHLLPHWNWAGKEGEAIPVYCYTSYPAAELFLNGRSLGMRRKSGDTVFSRYRLMWDNVVYEPGVLRVVAYDAYGMLADSAEVVTSGPPARIELSADRTGITADGEDLAFVTVRIVDDIGRLCPWADHLVQFSLVGSGGRIVAVDNGDQTSLEPFQASSRRAFHGMCMAVVAADAGDAGSITLKAEAEGVAAATVSINVW